MGLGDYGSHYPILAAAVAKANGPVLELGAGDWSTPMLHYLCRSIGRQLVTIDTDQNWLDKYKGYENERHVFHCTKDWMRSAEYFSQGWGVVFVDCAPGEIRHKLIPIFQKSAIFIVAHDSERDYGTGANYEYEKVIPLFKHVSEWRRFRPYTLILSDVERFEIEECDKVWDPKNI